MYQIDVMVFIFRLREFFDFLPLSNRELAPVRYTDDTVYVVRLAPVIEFSSFAIVIAKMPLWIPLYPQTLPKLII